MCDVRLTHYSMDFFCTSTTKIGINTWKKNCHWFIQKKRTEYIFFLLTNCNSDLFVLDEILNPLYLSLSVINITLTNGIIYVFTYNLNGNALKSILHLYTVQYDRFPLWFTQNGNKEMKINRMKCDQAEVVLIELKYTRGNIYNA